MNLTHMQILILQSWRRVFCNSRIPKYIAEQNYEAACKEMLKYNKQCTKLPDGTKNMHCIAGT